ncbi:hypothetical protein MKX01_008544 [Papaver californicum]|nr:hypothetical protein MKX01_008544 [Papaver californicum]
MGVFTNILFIAISAFFISTFATACSNGQRKLLDECSSDGDCEAGLYCFSCAMEFSGSDNNSLPYNKYAYLTTHNAFAIDGEPSHNGVPRITFNNQEDTIIQQLNNGVRALMLDTYGFKDDIWLCHPREGKCHHITTFITLDTLKEIEAFLAANPSEIITLILEDYVKSQNGLTKVFAYAGLMKYCDMVENNQRLVVFTSDKSKQQSERIAYQWDYMVENQYGPRGMQEGECPNRGESSPINDKAKSLGLTCGQNSGDLVNMLKTCYAAAGNRWANFAAVDFYKRSEGGETFQAVDTLNGELLCGCDDVHACVVSISFI